MLPRPITPSQLRVELGRLGYEVSDRRLVDWRVKSLLPPLMSRGRGRGRGREQFWRSPGIVEHAVALCQLRALNYPNDEARLLLWLSGLPVSARAVQEAWLSRLGKLKLNLVKKKNREVRRRKSEFQDIEDEISALTTPYVRELIANFGYDRREISQPVIDLFGLVFRRAYYVDEDMLNGLLSLYPIITSKTFDVNSLVPAPLFHLIVQFVREHCSFHAVATMVSSVTEWELVQVHRRWRELLRLAPRVFPELVSDLESAKFVAAGFGKIIVPVFIWFVREGKTSQIDKSIVEISQFCGVQNFSEIVRRLIHEGRISEADKIALAQLVAMLATIWNHKGFPFSLSVS